ncbi:hypothetical protein TSUD_91570 [Trifolium subterraneum]|uniref:Uncharacterized protein n=1 Tax=Trifolium subterraneum TaxID=3900 RepID=A0A2Z6PJR7_TRISU|nr:hypothetical protein TSUD_91570 [Trifolium subterraneum]
MSWGGGLLVLFLMTFVHARGIPRVTGRLGCSLEGAGKRRIFAISNYMNQRLLKPVHQGRSFDLKSATERWSLYCELLHFFHLATLHSLTGFGRATATFLERPQPTLLVPLFSRK